MKETTGAKLIVETLASLGIKKIFGYTGNYILPVFDAIKDSSIEVFVPSSELGGAHSADGYARATDGVGVVITTSGPGATNLVTGIATAYMDSVPVLAITANVPRKKLGKDSFQEVDITGIVTPITKYSHIITSVDELEYEIKKAYALASSGRKGPVLLDIPYDVLNEKVCIKNVEYSLPKAIVPDKNAIDKAIALLNEAVNPIILVGGGAKDASKEISLLAEKLSCPIVTTMRGVGAVDSANLLGVVGYSAPYSNNTQFKKADVVLALGTRFSDKMYAKSKGKKYIHVDIDLAELDKIVETNSAILGDVKDVLPLLLNGVKARNLDKKFTRGALKKNRLTTLASAIAELDLTDVIVATDVGSHQIALLNALGAKNHKELLSSTGLGTMGYGLPASIGASIATGKHVLLLTSDGSFNMNFNEISTAVKYGVDLTVVIANNRSLGMIEDIQRNKFNARYIGIDTPDISYALLAKSMGAQGARLTLPKAQETLQKALTERGVKIYEVRI